MHTATNTIAPEQTLEQELSHKAFNVIKNGYMPVNNKNLITFVTITTLFAITTAAAFSLGFQLQANTAESHLTSLQEYRQLEADIISSYEAHHGIEPTLPVAQIQTPYSYLDETGLMHQITVPALSAPR
jgi:hypothetical protein